MRVRKQDDKSTKYCDVVLQTSTGKEQTILVCKNFFPPRQVCPFAVNSLDRSTELCEVLYNFADADDDPSNHPTASTIFLVRSKSEIQRSKSCLLHTIYVVPLKYIKFSLQFDIYIGLVKGNENVNELSSTYFQRPKTLKKILFVDNRMKRRSAYENHVSYSNTSVVKSKLEHSTVFNGSLLLCEHLFLVYQAFCNNLYKLKLSVSSHLRTFFRG